jgi:hypothetical protein
MSVKYSPSCGIDIGKAAGNAISLATCVNDNVEMDFNGTKVLVCPTHMNQVIYQYEKERE